MPPFRIITLYYMKLYTTHVYIKLSLLTFPPFIRFSKNTVTFTIFKLRNLSKSIQYRDEADHIPAKNIFIS